MAWRCELCPGLGWDGAGVSRSVRVEPVTLGASYGLDATRRGRQRSALLDNLRGSWFVPRAIQTFSWIWSAASRFGWHMTISTQCNSAERI